MELIATIASVLPMQTGISAKGEWKKATVIVEYMDGQYKQSLALDNLKNADVFAALPVGQMFKFHFTLSSRENSGRWFTSAVCWKWEPVAAQAQPQAMPQAMPTPPPAYSSNPNPYNVPGVPPMAAPPY